MSDLKTRPTRASVRTFLDSIEDDERRRECRLVMKIMRQVTGAAPRMWGPSIVGYGRYHYRYASGREGDWFLTGLSPRGRGLTVYIMSGFEGRGALMRRLGKFRTGKSCLYLKRLADVDLEVLTELVQSSVDHLRRRTTDADM
jgi:hypothetical protein